MNYNPCDTAQLGNVMRVDNAYVVEASCFDNRTGYLVISYASPDTIGTVSMKNLRLNVSRNTTVINSNGRSISLCNIQKGMNINAVFSLQMTRSIPPQSNAYLIVLDVNSSQSSTSSSTTGRIASVDYDTGLVFTGNPNDINDQKVYAITDDTRILDRNGNSVNIYALHPGQTVDIVHANFQTASIPPRTTAYRIQIL
ncbi:MAG: hypothetical protein KHZ62_10105 [Clostridiales bacterium]|nr:hypothetical protein [Clostridiales bacterium]